MDSGLSWRFPRVFWMANTVELFERAAFYGMYIVITLYLTDAVGFTDVETGWIAGTFASLLYLMPTFSGALADKWGFKPSLTLAFGLSVVGYGMMGLWVSRPASIISLAIILLGGSFVKPIISGTVAKCSSETNRARAFAIFYMVVNMGGFLGKTFAYPLRIHLGVEKICLYSSAMSLCALIVVLIFYKNPDVEGVGKSVGEVARALLKVLTNGRFMAIILIVAGFWVIQSQLYSSIPKYTIRMIDPSAAPEWLANINPFVIVCFQLIVTSFTQKIRGITSMTMGMAVIPISALVIAQHKLLGPGSVSILGFTIFKATFIIGLGIAVIAVAEMLLSPRFLEYASKQAPPGDLGLYMGFSHLTTFFAKIAAFVISGYLLDAFCPDPKKLAAMGITPEVTPEKFAASYEHAPYLWYTFAAIGIAAFLALLAFRFITDAIDRKKEQEAGQAG